MISGFHRSGTSLTANYLHRAGLNLGNKLLGANPSNPDGHFEDQDIVALHKDILVRNHRDWFTPGPDLSANANEFRARAKALMSKFPTDESIGFKDPRSSLLLPWWHQQLDNPAAIIVFRHYTGCYHSLRNRQAQNLVFAPSQHKDALFFWQQPALALELWLSYNNAIIDYVKLHRSTTLLVSHQSMLDGFNLPSAVNQALGLSLDTKCNSGIRRASKPPCHELSDNIDTALKNRLDNMLASLNALCCSDPEPSGNAIKTLHQTEIPAKAPVSGQRREIEHWFDKLNIPKNTNERLQESPLQNHPCVVPPPCDAGYAEQSTDIKQLIRWGKAHQARQCDNAAEACWAKAHQLAPANVSALLHLALLNRNHGDNAEAARLMQTVIQLKPDNAGYHYHLARALNGCDQPEQALGIVRHGLSLQWDHRDLHLLQLKLLLKLNSHTEARKACDKALSLFPDDAGFMKIMVSLAGDSDDSNTAMIWFRRSVLTRIRKNDDYRRTLLQALEQIPANQQSAMANRVIEELEKLYADARPDRAQQKSANNFRLAMSILVRDEADLIQENILYHAAAGVDHFIVTDNGSIDGTREILEGLKQQVELTIIDEPSHTIDQDLWVTRMAHAVRDSDCADWIINNDADEFWLSHAGSLKEAIGRDLHDAEASGTTVGTLYCQRFNLIPSLETVIKADYRFCNNHYKVTSTLYELHEGNPWHENHSNALIRTLPGKVISRLDGLDSIDMGNHGAQHQHARLECNSVSIAHYPVRSYEQFERKVVNYGKSLVSNTRFAPNVSRHLRFWYEQYQLGNLYQEYLKFVLPEARLKQLSAEGIVSHETHVDMQITSKISPFAPLPMGKTA